MKFYKIILIGAMFLAFSNITGCCGSCCRQHVQEKNISTSNKPSQEMQTVVFSFPNDRSVVTTANIELLDQKVDEIKDSNL